MKGSATLKIQEIVNKRKNLGLPVYNFGLGANPLSISQEYLNEINRYAVNKNYVSACGIDKFQNVIKKTYSNDNYKIKHILTGNGLKELLFVVHMAFDGIIIHITPSWVSYKEQINMLNKANNLVEIETKLENNYKIDPIQLDITLSNLPDLPKLMIFNNPNNPTGVVHTKKDIEQIAKILNKHNVMVMADEIYGDLAYIPTESISMYIPHLTIRGSSVSKNLGWGGYRLGWITFPHELTDFFETCHSIISSLYSCTTTHIQYATAELFDNQHVCQHIFNTTKIVFKTIIKDICELIDKSNCCNMIKYVYPQSAWYLFLNFDTYKDKLVNNHIFTSIELQDFLLENFGIATVAGERFNIDGLNLRFSLVDIHLRFSLVDIHKINETQLYTTGISDKMKEGIELLINFFEQL
jgi:aspartate aminotransferase